MNRRRLMMLAGGLPLMSTAYAQTVRRSRPGDPSWPSDSQWQELNARVGGQLVQVAADRVARHAEIGDELGGHDPAILAQTHDYLVPAFISQGAHICVI